MCGEVPYIAKGKPFQKSFQIAANIAYRCYYSTSVTRSHTAAHRGKQGVLWMGVLLLPSVCVVCF